MSAHCVQRKSTNFEELLKRNGSASVHYQNIRFLATEMFKIFKSISPQVVKEIFHFRDSNTICT